jgi:hypothetical protein
MDPRHVPDELPHRRPQALAIGGAIARLDRQIAARSKSV